MANGATPWQRGPTGFTRRTARGDFQSMGYASEQGKRMVKAYGLPEQLTWDAADRAAAIRKKADEEYYAAIEADRQRRFKEDELRRRSDVEESIARGKPTGRFAPTGPSYAWIPPADGVGPPQQIEVDPGRPGVSMKDIMLEARALGYIKEEPAKKGFSYQKRFDPYTGSYVQERSDGKIESMPNQVTYAQLRRERVDFIKELKKEPTDGGASIWEGAVTPDEVPDLEEQAAARGLEIIWEHIPAEQKKRFGLDFLAADQPEEFVVKDVVIKDRYDATKADGTPIMTKARQMDPSPKPKRKVGEEKVGSPAVARWTADQRRTALTRAVQQMQVNKDWTQFTDSEKQKAYAIAEELLQGMI